MRIIGARDYYDGTAFRSDGTVLSMLVYRRDEDRSETVQWMRSALGVAHSPLRLRLRTFDDGPRPRRPAHGLLRPEGCAALVRWNGATLRIDEGAALFCGMLRNCVLVQTEHEWSDRNTHVEEEWCWSADELETTLAGRGLRPTPGWDRSWFDPQPVAGSARRAGLCVATLHPGGRGAGGRSWRVEAATLGGMDFEQVLPARDALARLADWIGGVASKGSRTRLRVATSEDSRSASNASHRR